MKINHWLVSSLRTLATALQGNVAIRNRSVPKATLIGVLGVILLYVSVAGIISTAVPWNNKSDTKYHIDYVWRVYNGELPQFAEGVTYTPLKNGAKMHLTASHPPLFYMLHAPFLGPLLKEGNWKGAIALGRAINIFIGVLCIIAFAWAGWTFGGSQKALMAVAVPAVSALMYRFTTLNVVFGNDVLIVLFATLAFICMYKIVEKGLRSKYFWTLGLISILGMATRAPYVVILLVSFASILAAAVLHNKKRLSNGLMLAAIKIALIGVAVALTIGWFYHRNFQASGSWFKSSPDSFDGGRTYKSLRAVIASTKLWALFYNHSSNAPFLATIITSFAAAGYLSVISSIEKVTIFCRRHKPQAILIGLMIVATIGILLTQIKFAVGYGSINFRYFLPVLLPIGLFLAYGLTRFKVARGQLVAVFVVATAFTTIWPVATSEAVSTMVPAVLTVGNNIEKVFIAISSNGVSPVVTSLLMGSFVVGSALLAITLYVLSLPNRVVRASKRSI